MTQVPNSHVLSTMENQRPPPTLVLPKVAKFSNEFALCQPLLSGTKGFNAFQLPACHGAWDDPYSHKPVEEQCGVCAQ